MGGSSCHGLKGDTKPIGSKSLTDTPASCSRIADERRRRLRPRMLDVSDLARWLAAAAVSRHVSVALHELSHVVVASALGHKTTVELAAPEAFVEVSRPLSKLEDALIRHAGWIASLALAFTSVISFTSCYGLASAGDVEDVIRATGGPEVGFATLGVVLVALEALHSDLLSPSQHRGLFRCGNFGMLLLRQANACRVDQLLRRMLQITMMRGAQSAGVVTYQDSVGVRHRIHAAS